MRGPAAAKATDSRTIRRPERKGRSRRASYQTYPSSRLMARARPGTVSTGLADPVTISGADPRVHCEVQEVDRKIHEKRERGGDEDESLNRGEVRVDDRLNCVLPGATPAEHDLDEHGSAKEITDQHAHDRDYRGEGVPERPKQDCGAPKPEQLEVLYEGRPQHVVHR